MKQCEKCLKMFEDNEFVRGETYKAIDEHHNPPKFLMDKDKWKGELPFLCRECHREIHNIIIRMMNKKAGTLKFLNSEHWLLKKMSLNQRDELAVEVFNFTKEWLKDGNS